MLFNFKRIQSKILVGFSMIIVLVLGLTVYNNVILSKNNQTVAEIVNRDFPIVLGDEKIIRSIYDRIGSARGYLLTGDQLHKEQFERAAQLSDESHEEIEVRIPISGFEEVRQRTENWSDDIVQSVFEEYDNGNQKKAMENLLIVEAQVADLVSDYEGGATSRGNQIAELEQSLLKDGKQTRIIVGLVSVLITIFGVTIAIITARFISKPLQTVTNRMRAIADGDYSGAPLETKLKNEIGHLTVSTNQMSENMRILLNDIHGVSETVTERSEGLTQSAIEIKEGSNQIAITMEELALGAESQASRSGDLSSQMHSLVTSVQEINESGTEIQQSSGEVLQMTNEGAALMSLSTEQMTKIDQIVSDAVEKVKGLDAHTRKISELVLVIQGIADQTNLLALNATIEAARAGEQGKGFAVVADEVRKLAEQSSGSVANITEIVNSIQSESVVVVSSLQTGYAEVEEGSEQIKVTGDTFENIREAVTEMATRIEQMSENLATIQTDTVEMNDAIGEIAAISETSAAGVEETSATTTETSLSMEEISASAYELENTAEQLNGLVNRFKL